MNEHAFSDEHNPPQGGKPTFYGVMVAALAKPGEQILQELTARQAALLHMAVGICGEAGELLDAVKKHVIYQRPLDGDNVVEELGDLEFYMEGLRQIIDVTRERCLTENRAKLATRYGEQYSNEAAIARTDKLCDVSRTPESEVSE